MRNLALVLGAVSLLAAQTAPATPDLFNELAAAYAAGDRDVLNKRLTGSTVRDFHRSFLQAMLEENARAKTAPPWTRARAAFLLEVAVWSAARVPTDVKPALSAGFAYLMTRPARLGSSTDDDAFEVQWHRTALSVFQRVHDVDSQRSYLDSLERRYVTGPEAKAARATLDPRFVLARVIAAEQEAFMLGGVAGKTAPTTRLTAVARPSDSSSIARALKRGLVASEKAIALADVVVEATVRRAVLLTRLGQFDDALETVRRVPRADADGVQLYWTALVEARLLHELKRLPEAEQAYRDLAPIWPDAPAPMTGLALVLFDMNKRDDAVAAAAAARAIRKEVDPWWLYVSADSRFTIPWRNALRGMIK